jgi:hypothetical protein
MPSLEAAPVRVPAAPGRVVDFPADTALVVEAGGWVVEGGQSTRGWHFYEHFIRCPRLFGFAELGMLDQENSPPLVRGTLLHLGLGQWRARRIAEEIEAGRLPSSALPTFGGQPVTRKAQLASPLAAVAAAVELGVKRGGLLFEQVWRGIHRRVVDALRAYVARYGDEPVRPFLIERELRAGMDGAPHFAGRFLYTQRLDWAVEDADGIWWIYDIKGVAWLSPQVIDRYTLSGQFLGFAELGRRVWGARFGGCYLDLVGFGKELELERVRVPVAPGAQPRFVRDLAWHEGQRRALEEAGVPLDQYPGRWSEFTCRTPYGPCPAFDLCRFGAAAGGDDGDALG